LARFTLLLRRILRLLQRKQGYFQEWLITAKNHGESVEIPPTAVHVVDAEAVDLASRIAPLAITASIEKTPTGH
jgi:hypothetical protein